LASTTANDDENGDRGGETMVAEKQVAEEIAQAHATAYEEPIYRQALEHVWIHSGNWAELAEKQGLHVFERGEGIYLYDTLGKQWIDGIAGLWVVNAGHGRREIGEAMAEQAGKVAYASAASYTTVPAVQLADTLAELTPGDLSRVFYCSGGSEAVETALKIAKQVQALRGFPKRYKVIARRGSYHGATYGAMSLTTGNRPQVERFFGPLMAGVYHVPSPNHYRNDFDLEGEAGDIMCAKWVEQEILFQGPETVAAVIGEPISSSNGVHIPSPRYWQLLREICDRHGVLLIMDEVINGFGRTGKWFATEHFGVVPDIMTMAKGLSSGYCPIAAAIVRPSVFEIFQNADNGCVRNGTTGAVGACGGRREGGPGGGQAAASSAMIVAQRSWNTRRRSPSETASPDRATGRKYWRCSSKAVQKRAADVNEPNPRIG